MAAKGRRQSQAAGPFAEPVNRPGSVSWSSRDTARQRWTAAPTLSPPRRIRTARKAQTPAAVTATMITIPATGDRSGDRSIPSRSSIRPPSHFVTGM
uniref:hypothetical protein n=1 Tax=Herbidospora sakaeratensis TaxID=564415 RepID=UPI0007849215|nr:hypothetical protein [Herbidospora sakaeratensis]